MNHLPGIVDEQASAIAAPGPTSARRLPDFVIGGAPKCGTTSLHFILAQQPGIGIPDDELFYFSADDPILHPDFFFFRDGGLQWLDPRPAHRANADWYADRFEPFADCRLIGEDSTLYLFSETAPHRMRETLTDPKIIFMLRDPVRRAYSQYWHEMKMMRVTCSFERALTRFPTIVRGSTYAPHLSRWFDVLGRDRVHVLLFEEFLADKQGAMDQVADFIGTERFDVSVHDDWFNRTYYPVNVTLHKAMNQVGRFIARQRYRSHMGYTGTWREWLAGKAYYNWFHKVNPLNLKATTYPKMKPATEAYLTQHLNVRNRGLSDLLGRDLSAVWPSFEG